MKTHFAKENKCDVCEREFTFKHQLQSHLKQHQYPKIPLYRPGEARLHYTKEAKSVADRVANAPCVAIDPTRLNPDTAEAKKSGGEMWTAQLVCTFGRYAGQSFKWLLENDVGWVVWLLAEYCLKGEQNDLLKWEKTRLLEFVKEFPSVTCHLDKRLEVR